jgi:hypothetical protein
MTRARVTARGAGFGAVRRAGARSGVRLVAIAANAREQHPGDYHDDDGTADQQFHLREAEGARARGSDSYGLHGDYL